MNQLVVYGGGAALQQLPKALRAAVAAANSVGSAVAIIRKSAWYLSQANGARKAIVNAFTKGAGGGNSSGVQRNVIPKVSSKRAAYQRGTVTGSIVQSHREYVMDVSPTGTGFQLTKFQISPSDRFLFKSLAYISRCFDKYRFRKLRFVYVPSCSTTTGGRVAGAFEYDLNDPEPSSKADLYAMESSRRGPFYENLTWDMTPTGWMDVSLTGEEPKLSCPGYFAFAAMECDTVGVKGELYVEYEVELKISSKFVAVQQSFNLNHTGGVLNTSQTSTGDNVVEMLGSKVSFLMEGTFLLYFHSINLSLTTLSLTAGAGVVATGVRTVSGTGASSILVTVKATRGGNLTLTVPNTATTPLSLTVWEV